MASHRGFRRKVQGLVSRTMGLSGDGICEENQPMKAPNKALQSNRSGRRRLTRDLRLSSPRAVAELGVRCRLPFRERLIMLSKCILSVTGPGSLFLML